MKINIVRRCAALALLTSLSLTTNICFAAEGKPIEVAAIKHEGPVDFQKEILPIMRRNCLACHNSTDAEGDLILETPQQILTGGGEGPSVVPGKGSESLLLQVAAHQKEPLMPPPDNDVRAKALTPQELGLLKLWIDQGAKGDAGAASQKIVFEPLPIGINPIYAVAISRDGQYVAAGRANQIFLYHVPSKRPLGRLTDPALLKSGIYKNPGVAHLDLVQSLSFSPDGTTLASGGYRTAKLWRRGQNVKVADVTGLESAPQSAAVSTDGKWAAVGEQNGKVKLIDLSTNKVARTLTGHTGPVSGVAFSSDSTKLVSGSQDKTVRLWNVADGKQVDQPITGPAAVNAVAFVSKDTQLASGDADNTIRVWNLPGTPVEGAEKKDGDPAADAAQPVREIKGHGGPITSLAAVGDGTQLVSGSQDSTVRIWTVATGAAARSMSHGGPVTSVAVRVDGQRIASASSNNTAKIWNAANGQQIAELRGDFRSKLRVTDLDREVALAKIKLDLVKKDLAAANKRKTDEEANAKKAGETLKTAQDDFNKKTEAAKKPLADKAAADKQLDADKAALATAEANKKKNDDAITAANEAVKKAQAAVNAAKDDNAKTAANKVLADANKKKQDADNAKKVSDKAFTDATNKVKQAEAKVKQLAAPATKASDELAASDRAFKAAQRSVERAKVSVKKATDAIPVVTATVTDAEAHQKQVTADLENAKKAATESEKPFASVAFSTDGKTIATGGESQIIYTWDAETGAAIDSITGQGAVIADLAFTTEHKLLAFGANNSAAVWDTLPEWTLVRTIGSIESSSDLVDRVTALAFSPDGKILATGGGDPSRSGELKLWNVADGKLLREIKEAHSDTILGMEFSGDGQHIASSAADRFMKVHQVADGKFVRSFEGHTHHVLGVSWSADGRKLASCGADKAIKYWTFKTGDQLKPSTGFSKEVTAVRFAGNGVNVVASCGDGVVHMRRSDNGGNVRTFSGGKDYMYNVSISADGKVIAAGGQDSVLRLWSDNGQVVASFEPPQPDQTASAAK